MFHDMYDSSHPGVDAALILLDALFILDFFRPFARIKTFDRLLIALRDRRAESTGIVEELHDAAAEFFDFSERMLFAALIDGGKHITRLDREFARSHVPGTHRVVKG